MAKKKKDTELATSGSFMDSVTNSVEKLFGKEKVFGKGFATKRLSELPDYGSKEWISSGSILIDGAIGRAGIPVGKLTTLIGPAGSGKTTQLVHFIKSAQEKGFNVVYVDSEGKFDPARSRAIGVDNDNVLYYTQITLEQMFGLCLAVAKEAIKVPEEQRVPTLICVDSHSALATRSQTEQEINELDRKQFVGDAAGNTRHGLRLLVPLMPDAKIALVFVCQPTEKIGGFKTFGPPPETYIAQKAIDHHSILRIKYSRTGTLYDKPNDKDNRKSIGGLVTVRVEDSRISPPKRSANIQCLDSTGFDDIDCMLDLGIDNGIIQAYGAGYFAQVRCPDAKKFRRGEFREIYDSDPTLRQELFSLAYGLIK